MHGVSCLVDNYSEAHTVFARSDAAATIYFIAQFLCGNNSRAATN